MLGQSYVPLLPESSPPRCQQTLLHYTQFVIVDTVVYPSDMLPLHF
jgi:hypothetical protein